MPACRCCRSWRGERVTRTQIGLYTIPMAVAAVLPWPLGLTGAVYGWTASITTAVFALFAAQVALRQTGAEDRMTPEKRLFSYSILYLFVISARWSPIAGCWQEEAHDPRRTGSGPSPPAVARDRDGGAALRFRAAGLRHLDRQDPGGDAALSDPAARTRRTALLAVLGIAFMTGLAWASVPLYRLFCQATG